MARTRGRQQTATESASQRASARERQSARRKREQPRCSSVDDSSLPWGARATHTPPRSDACVHGWCTRVQREPVSAMHSPLRADLYMRRGPHHGANGVYVQGHRVQRAERLPPGSHRPHQHHSITRGTLWNHLPNHLVTSTQRNATARRTVSFAGIAGCFERAATQSEGGTRVPS